MLLYFVCIAGKTGAVPSGAIWGLLILLIVGIIISCCIFYHNRRKKHGQYSFVPENGSDKSIPLTTNPDRVHV